MNLWCIEPWILVLKYISFCNFVALVLMLLLLMMFWLLIFNDFLFLLIAWLFDRNNLNAVLYFILFSFLDSKQSNRTSSVVCNNMTSLSKKCMFLKKPLETMMLAQTQRTLFVDSTLKCPIMSKMLSEKVEANKGNQ